MTKSTRAGVDLVKLINHYSLLMNNDQMDRNGTKDLIFKSISISKDLAYVSRQDGLSPVRWNSKCVFSWNWKYFILIINNLNLYDRVRLVVDLLISFPLFHTSPLTKVLDLQLINFKLESILLTMNTNKWYKLDFIYHLVFNCC